MCLLVFIFGVGFSAKANAATYYVDCNAANDNGAGTSEGTAWKTIAKVNATLTGDQSDTNVLFKKDCTWREQLTVPGSGTSGHPFTFGAYGTTGAKPIISGADLVAGSWTQTTTNISGNVARSNMRMSIVNGTAFVDFSSAGALTNYLGAQLTITDYAGKTLTGYIKATGTGETYGSELLRNTTLDNTTGLAAQNSATLAITSSGCQTGSCLIVTIGSSKTYGGFQNYINGGGVDGALYKNSLYVNGGTGDYYDFTFASSDNSELTTTGQLVVPGIWTQTILYATNAKVGGTGFDYPKNYAYTHSVAGETVYFDTPSAKKVLTPSANGVTITSTANDSTYNWTSEDVGFNRNDSHGYTYSISNVSVANVWQIAATTEPTVVTMNGILGNKKASIGALAAEHDWFWTSNVLYIYSATDPGTAYTSPGVEIGQRTYCIGVSGSTKRYITIDGFSVRAANQYGIYAGWNPDHWTIKNSEASYMGGGLYGAGIIVYNDGTGSLLIDNNNVHDNEGMGIYIYKYDSGGGTESTISGNSVYDNGGYGIYVMGNYWIVEHNTVHDNGQITGASQGITLMTDQNDGYGQHNIIRYNTVYNQDNQRIVGDGAGIVADQQCDNNEIYNNITYNNDGAGISIYEAQHIQIYNNVAYGNNQESSVTNKGEIKLQSSPDWQDVDDITIKNNIGYATVAGGYAIWIGPNAYENTLNVTNNDWYRTSGNWYFWNATGGSDLATWNGLTGVGTGLNSNPLFTDVSSHDFRLLPTSPAIGAGTDVSLTFDYAGNPIYGTPDIGAYEYQPTETMGEDRIPTDVAVRTYGDEKYRDKATTSQAEDDQADLSVIIPASDITDWLDIQINTWLNTDNYNKNWTESTTSDITNTIHIIGDLEADKYYNVTVDDSTANLTGDDCNTVSSNFVCLSDDEGKIVFTYTGTYSEHTFDVVEGDNVGPTTTASPDGGTYTTAQMITLTCNDDGGVGCDKTYYTTDGTEPTTGSTEYATPITISATTTLKFFSTDLNGESEAVKTKTYVIEPEDDDERDINVNKVKAVSDQSSITLTWKTDHNAKSTVRYGTNKNLKQKKNDNQKEKNHKVILKNLLPDTKYYFRIKSEDGNDNKDSSRIHSIKTKPVLNSNSISTQNTNQNPKETTIATAYSGNPSPNVCSYTVQAGDMLWSIAKKVYGDATAYTKIIEINRDKYPNIGTKLSIGQELTFGCNSENQGAVNGASDIKDNAGNNNPETPNPGSLPEGGSRWWNPFSWF